MARFHDGDAVLRVHGRVGPPSTKHTAPPPVAGVNGGEAPRARSASAPYQRLADLW
jgi:hypothetical protein